MSAAPTVLNAEAPRVGSAVSVAVVQDGARLHYALPLALQSAGILNRVFTDWFVTPGSLESLMLRAVRCFSPDLARRMGERKCAALNPSTVRRSPWLVLKQQWGHRRFRSDVEILDWIRHVIGRWVEDQGLGNANTLMGVVGNIDPQLCAWAARRGVMVVGDQVGAPMKVFMQHCLQESARWPGWEKMGTPQEIRQRYEAFGDVEEQTWRELDHVTCASAYVRRGLESQGVAAERISLIPYPIDASAYTVPDRRGRTGPVTIGLVGRVSLLKGAPYFFEVARRLKSESVRFVMIGPVALDDAVTRQHKGNVELIGRVSRSQVASWLERFDLLLFPSVSEGLSGAVMEAMCMGLPVVVSTNSGSVARDGIEGFSAAYDDVDALAGYVQRLVADQNLRHEMGRAARARVESFNIDSYGAALKATLCELLARKAQSGTGRRKGDS
jgi:glycosyltransferase involved in cell wall biosynthesis